MVAVVVSVDEMADGGGEVLDRAEGPASDGLAGGMDSAPEVSPNRVHALMRYVLVPASDNESLLLLANPPSFLTLIAGLPSLVHGLFGPHTHAPSDDHRQFRRHCGGISRWWWRP